MFTKEEFKKLLETIQLNNYTIPMELHPFNLALEAMNYIGDIDSQLRDNLVNSFIETLINRKELNDDEVRDIITISINNLTFGINKKKDDDVFVRTFSMLIIAVAIYRHRMDSYLINQELKSIFNEVVNSFIKDNDVRGYIEEKGWAHGAAHGADVFCEFAKLEETDEEMMKTILQSIYQKVNISHYGYIHSEDERMAKAVLAVIDSKKLFSQYIIEWFNQFALIRQKGASYMVKRNNVRNFLWALYFRLKDNEILSRPLYQVIKNNLS